MRELGKEKISRKHCSVVNEAREENMQDCAGKRGKIPSDTTLKKESNDQMNGNNISKENFNKE